nr:hypothetical protein [uncultured Cetobacterium sp.]
MKKILILLGALSISMSSFAYKAKSEDLSKYTLENYKPQVEKTLERSGLEFDEVGKIYDSPSLGYYNFVSVKKDGKVIAYVGLTHIKSYNKHEALLATISPDGKLLGFYLPDVNEKHPNVNEKEWMNKYINKSIDELPVDSLAGSTFHAHSVNGELRNLLRAFDYKKDILTENN